MFEFKPYKTQLDRITWQALTFANGTKPRPVYYGGHITLKGENNSTSYYGDYWRPAMTVRRKYE